MTLASVGSVENSGEMLDDILWLVLVAPGGREVGRVPIAGWTSRHELPLRALAEHGLRHPGGNNSRYTASVAACIAATV